MNQKRKWIKIMKMKIVQMIMLNIEISSSEKNDIK